MRTIPSTQETVGGVFFLVCLIVKIMFSKRWPIHSTLSWLYPTWWREACYLLHPEPLWNTNNWGGEELALLQDWSFQALGFLKDTEHPGAETQRTTHTAHKSQINNKNDERLVELTSRVPMPCCVWKKAEQSSVRLRVSGPSSESWWHQTPHQTEAPMWKPEDRRSWQLRQTLHVA